MTERAAQPYGDPISAPFWEGAARRELLLQRCSACGRHQFYPRPFCLACASSAIEWIRAAGTGTVYSMTTVRRAVVPGHEPPYVVALVELDEGVRLLSNLVGEGHAIGGRVRVAWRGRANAPPVPVFEVDGVRPG